MMNLSRALAAAGRGSITQVVALVVALALTTLLLTQALRSPAPQTLDVGASGDAFFLANFYPSELDAGATTRWSSPGSRLLLPASFQGAVALTMRLHGAPFAPPDDLRLSLGRPGQPPTAFATDAGWRVYRLLLPPGEAGAPAGGQAPLEIVAPPAIPGSADLRPLGVTLDRVDLRYLGPAPLGPPLVRALLIAWGIGLAARAIGRGVLQACGAIATGAGMALWAWRDPGGFAWAVPTPPIWLLVVGTAIILLSELIAASPRSAQAIRAMRVPFAPAWALLIGHLALLLPLPWRGLGALIVLGLPGWLAARALFPDEDDPIARLFLGLCGALVVAPLLILALHAIPGPLPAWPLLLAADILSAAMLWLLSREPGGAEGRTAPPQNSLLLLLIAVGVALRLTLLGGAEFQGDEARAMLLAVGIAQGDDGILLAHRKGPVEALLPAGPVILAGAGVEWVARLPFALAGTGLLLGVAALARRVLPTANDQRPSSVAALVAVALLATDGFALGFARIVQYQSIVMLMSAGAVWCCWRFYAGAGRPARYLLAAASMLAVGIMSHYDAAMAAPALAWLTLAGGRRRGWAWREWLTTLGPPALLGAALLASFFVPYVLSDSFATNASYLSGRISQSDTGEATFNNLPLYLRILSFYNAPQLVALLAPALVAAICLPLALMARPRALGWLAAAVLLAASLAQALSPQLMAPPGLAALAFGLALAVLCLAPGADGATRALAIWFAVPFFVEAFVVAEPRTHFYSAHPPAYLLIGLAAAWLVGRVRGGPPALHIALRLGGALWMAASLSYAQLVYLRQFPEYERAFPAARPGILLAGYGGPRPEAGYFGFPHKDGWKAAAELARSGVIVGGYDTNQNRWLAGWYLRSLPHCPASPDYYLIAEALPTRYFPPGYSLLGEITVGPSRALAIYSRAPVEGPPQLFSSEELAAAFDARPIEPFPAGAIVADTPRPECGS
jgi:hypothetical protein